MIRYKKGTQGYTLITSPKRYFISLGGRASGRSFTASLGCTSWLFDKENQNRIVITRQFEKDIEDSIFREVKDRISDLADWLSYYGYFENLKITDKGITFTTPKFENRVIPFGFQTSSKDIKTKGKSLTKINKLVMEECQDNKEEDFIRLDDSLRSANTKICLLSNPPSANHWLVKKFFDLEPVQTPLSNSVFFKPHLKKGWETSVDFFNKTYLDNPNLPEIIKERYANYGNPNHPSFDPDHFYNQIMGLIPALKQGLVFKNWIKGEEEPDWESLDFKTSKGLDFGFNDPTAFVMIAEKETLEGKILFVKELFYKKELTPDSLLKEVLKTNIGNKEIICDSARPELISYLQNNGINVESVYKGKNSVLDGITALNNYKKIILFGNNLVNEFENYSYKLTNDKSLKDEPIDDFNHLIDAIRYAKTNLDIDVSYLKSFSVKNLYT